NRKSIWHYYVVGHVTGSEKGIRAVEAGLLSQLDHLLFYPKNLYYEHVGLAMAAAMAVAAVAALLLRCLYRSRAAAAPGRVDTPTALGLFLAALFVPLGILALDTAKSFNVADILVPPLLFLSLLPFLNLPARWPAGVPAIVSRSLMVLGAGALACGVYVQA